MIPDLKPGSFWSTWWITAQEAEEVIKEAKKKGYKYGVFKGEVKVEVIVWRPQR